jgi:hypothetical protein
MAIKKKELPEHWGVLYQLLGENEIIDDVHSSTQVTTRRYCYDNYVRVAIATEQGRCQSQT